MTTLFSGWRTEESSQLKQMLRIRTFKQSIIYGFLFATFLPLIFLGYFSYSYLSYKISESEQMGNELLAEATAKEISSYLLDPLTVLRQILTLVLLHEHDDREINSHLDQSIQESNLLDSIYIVNNAKMIVNIGLKEGSSGLKENYIGLDLSNLGILRNIEYLQGPYWSQSFISPVSGKKSLAAILPTGDGRYAIGLFDIGQLHTVIRDRSSRKNSTIIVLDDSGKPVFHPQLKIVEEQQNFSHIEPFQEAMQGNFGTHEFSFNGEQFLSSSANISETKWLVLVVQSLKAAREPIIKMARLVAFVMVMAGVIVITISIYQVRKMMMPLKAMQENIQAVAAGDYQEENIAKLPYEEFEEVAEHFREMATAIERREQLLEINEERLVSLLQIHNLKHLSEQELLDSAIEQAVGLTRSEIGYIHILDGQEKNILNTMWSKDTEHFMARCNLTMQDLEEAGLWRECILKRVKIFRNHRGLGDENSSRQTSAQNIRQLCVPIFDEAKLVAIVGVLHKQADYDKTDARQLSLYFNHTWDILQQKKSDRDKERLTEQLAQAQKLEAIGTLAGGIAHDFNNVLMVIIGNTEIARDNVRNNPEKVSRDLDEIFKASLRARDLVNQILAFSRNTTEGMRPLDIRPIVKEAVKLLRSSIPANIEITQNIAEDSRPVVSEPGQINQLLMNLCTNSYQAMEGGKGKLEVTLHPITLEHDLYERGKTAVVSGNYMLLTVKDNGKGIQPEMINRIFEPYYTTREKERGTGLGLAVVHGIVKSLKGAVIVNSELGKGTEFAVYLPVDETETKREEQIISGSLPGGNEKICYVDDDEAVAAVNSRILENLGYELTTFTSSREAYDHIALNPGLFDLIITDMAMPEITGDILARKILEINSEVPIILCTGYSEQINEEKAVAIGIKELVLKPLTKLDLALTVRKVLGFKSNMV